MNNTQVNVNKTKLSILSIPRERYWIFVSAITQLLYLESIKSSIGSDFDSSQNDSDSEAEDMYGSCTIPNIASTIKNLDNTSKSNKPSDITQAESDIDSKTEIPRTNSYDELEGVNDGDENNFFHVAFTPSECTIICAEKIMTLKFKEPLKLCQDLKYDNIILVKEQFLLLQIDSDGSYDNSLRILDLTKPLSDNKIPLFFISSHFNDLVLIPYRIKDKVISVLQMRNFEFSDISNSYILNSEVTLSSSFGDLQSEFTTESTSNTMIEDSTFHLFKEVGTEPLIDKSCRLLLTAARVTEVRSSIMKAANIISSNLIPEYFTITRTSLNELSLILPKSEKIRRLLGFDSKLIIGSTQDVIIPISIDLSKLPIDSTGIVAGVASKIIHGIGDNSSLVSYSFEMKYFSMARSAVLMIPKENIEAVTCILNK